jgi:hypothetical protein
MSEEDRQLLKDNGWTFSGMNYVFKDNGVAEGIAIDYLILALKFVDVYSTLEKKLQQ